MLDIFTDSPGLRVLLTGNEAIARGAIESGLHVASAYPGTPSTEILETLALAAKRFNLHVEWSVNEIVSLEVAASASWSGLRALTAMKHNGLNTVMDFLIALSLSGSGGGGLIIVSADDPQSHSSPYEQDTRLLGRYAEIPTLEPSNPQEAKDMVPYAFNLSERFNLPVLMRGYTRLGHCSGDVVLGEIRRIDKAASINKDVLFHAGGSGFSPILHEEKHRKISRVEDEFEKSQWNRYVGPENPELLIITSGAGYSYSIEACRVLSLNGKVGILKIGTIHPLPRGLIGKYLSIADKVLFVEEIDPYLEEYVKALSVDIGVDVRFFGKSTNHIPMVGEINPDIVINSVVNILKHSYTPIPQSYREAVKEISNAIPSRTLTFCPGCPHRATYWCILRAIRRNGNRGYVTGDIGCYGLGRNYHKVMKTLHCMGASIGLASGFGVLGRFGLDEPIIAVIGDSTFYHAGIPALINILYNKSKSTICILDNGTTAMTGFQPHPGTGINALGDASPPVRIEDIARALGFRNISILDPFKIAESTEAVYKAITSRESHILIFRRKCMMLTVREAMDKGLETVKYMVDHDRCRSSRGCRLCLEFNCPAIHSVDGSASIDSTLCNGCGVCVQICPFQAIRKLGD
jgi:indolepyruvate ferredoxin oxidoreductase alpha subunit